MEKNVEYSCRIMFLILFFISDISPVDGNVGASNDTPYRTYNKDGYTYIYSTDWENYLDWVVDFNESLRQHYQESFGFPLDENTALSLTSTHNQVANAYATVVPFLQTVFYFGAAESIDEFSVRSWVADLLIHESSHLYQLSAKRDLSEYGHAIFGNNVPGNIPIPLGTNPLFFFPLPFLTHPNILMPTWLLEGNGVFNESRFGNGGRLFSGASRALFYSLLKANLLNEKRLTNNGLYFPYRTEKYIVGGYFNLYLAERFGVETTQRLFWAHAIHYFNPLRLNSTFKNHFGVSYSELIVDFLKTYSDAASKHSVEPNEGLFTSVRANPLNRIGDSIVFLNSGNGYNDPELIILNSNGEITRAEEISLRPGKIFWHDKKFKSATTGLVQRKYTHASLFDQAQQDTPEFDSKLVQDMDKKNGVLYFRMTEGFHSPVLYHNNKKIGPAHSSAIFSADGEAIYFRQLKDQRTCYKGKQPLFSFQGFYGTPMDVGPHGEVYFTGATAYGSGLFMWDNGKIYRLGQSDAVSHARRLQNERYLLVEFTPHGHVYKLATLSKQNESPFYYQYFFEKDSSHNLFASLLNDAVGENDSGPSYPVRSPELRKEFSEYSLLRNLRFSRWNLAHTLGDDKGRFDTKIYFVDPMDYNELLLEYEHDIDIREQKINFDYRVTRWLVNYGLVLEYERLEKSKILPPSLRDNNLLAELPISYNFFHAHKWKMDVEARPGYYWQSLNNPRGKDFPILYESLLAYKLEHAMLGLYPLRALSTELESTQDFLPSGTKNTWALTTKGTYHLGAQFYVMGEFNLVRTDLSSLDLGEELRDGSRLVPAKSVRGIKGAHEEYLYGMRTGAMLKTVIDWNWQGRVFPLGLRRLSPGILANYFATNTVNSAAPEQHFYQPGLTLEAELLFAHIIPVPIEIHYIEQIQAMRDGARNSEWQLNIKSSF